MPSTFHIVGDAFVDFFCYLENDWPELGGDACLTSPISVRAGGSGLNTATVLKFLAQQLVKQASDIVIQTVLNPNDDNGRILLDHLSKHGLNLINCRPEDSNSATGHCVVVVSSNDRSFMTHRGCVGEFAAHQIKVEPLVDVTGDLHVHVAGFFNMPGFWNGQLLEQLEQVRSIRRQRGAKTVVSLVTQNDATDEWNGGLPDLIPFLDFLFLNEVEATRIAEQGGSFDANDPLRSWMTSYTALAPRTCIVITRGSQGAMALRNGQLLGNIEPAPLVELIDPTGAGDAFIAGFLHGICSEPHADSCSPEAIRQGLLWGCATGSASVQIRGASEPPPIETLLPLVNALRQRVAK